MPCIGGNNRVVLALIVGFSFGHFDHFFLFFRSILNLALLRLHISKFTYSFICDGNEQLVGSGSS